MPLPQSKPRRLRRAGSDARAATSAEWPVMTALGVEDSTRPPGDNEQRTVLGSQIKLAASTADKLLRAEERRAHHAEEELEVVREQLDRAVLLLRRLGDAHYALYAGRSAPDVAPLHEAASALIGEIGSLRIEADVRSALAGVLADGPALEAAVTAALEAAVLAPPATSNGPHAVRAPLMGSPR